MARGGRARTSSAERGSSSRSRLRLRGERPGDRDALGLTAGQFRGLAVGELGTASTSAEPVARAISSGLGREGAPCCGPERDVVQHGEVGEEEGRPGRGGRSRAGGAASSTCARRSDRTACVSSRSRVRCRAAESGDDPEQRRLAGAVGPEDGDGLAGGRRRGRPSTSRSATAGREGARSRAGAADGGARAPRPGGRRPTTTTATTMSTRERATAASGSISRCR